MLKNLGIIKGVWGTTPVRVYDAGELWVYRGSMRAEIEGDLGATTLTWVQLTGDPVTYTSSTDGLTITFTTTDLQSKVFRCYTNKGTPNEAYDDGTYYHNPIDVVVCRGAKGNQEGLLTNFLYADHVKYVIQGGMIDKYNHTDNLGVVRIHGAIDQYTEVGFSNINAEVARDIQYTNIETKATGSSVWVLYRAYAGYRSKVGSLPLTADDFRITIRHINRGHVTDMVWYRDDLFRYIPKHGASDYVVPTGGLNYSALKNYSYLLQKITEQQVVDASELTPTSTLSILNSYQYALQTISSRSGSDQVTLTNTSTYHTLSTHDYTLQVSTIVG